MNDEKKEEKKSKDWQDCCPSKEWYKHHKHSHHHESSWGWAYFLGIIGTAVYYIQQVSGFWPVVLAILKAIVWPAFLLYKVFSMLNM